MIDPALDAINRESGRSIDSHLADYEHKLQTANRSDQYIRETIKYIRAISKAGTFDDVAAINADAVAKFASGLKDEAKSSRTIQAYLSAIKGFTRWLTEQHKLPRDPLASLKKPNPKADRRHERRMLPEEWWRLEAATAAGPERRGMLGGERLLLYRVAIQTGLRSSELRSLTRGCLYLDADPPYILCKAGSTKNQKEARQYIQPELAIELKAYIARKAPRTPVFNMPHETSLARMLRATWPKHASSGCQRRRTTPRKPCSGKVVIFWPTRTSVLSPEGGLSPARSAMHVVRPIYHRRHGVMAF